MKRWRRGNPHYFKQDELRGSYWRELYKRRIRKWRKEDPEYFKAYREKYKDRHREYMREYMRRYRGSKKVFLTDQQNINTTGPDAPPTVPAGPTE